MQELPGLKPDCFGEIRLLKCKVLGHIIVSCSFKGFANIGSNVF